VGRWLWCSHCGYNDDRDYCAALNIARLGIAYLIQVQQTGKGKAFAVAEIESVKPRPYSARRGAAVTAANRPLTPNGFRQDLPQRMEASL